MFEVLARFRHRRLRRDLSAYLDDMLSSNERRRLEKHLDTCAACRRELAELRVTRDSLSELPLAEVPRSFTLATVPEPVMRPRPVTRRLEFGLRLATTAAAFVLAVVVIGDFAGLAGDGGDDEAASVFTGRSEEEMAPPGVAPAPTMEGEGHMYAPSMADEEEGAQAAPTPEEEAAPPTISDAERQATGEPEKATPESTPEAAPGAPVAEETPMGMIGEAVPEATPEPPTVEEPAAGAADEVTPEATPAPPMAEERVMEVPTGEADMAAPEALVEEGDGGPSQEDVVLWLEIGLGAGVGVLVLFWALALRQVRGRARSE